MIALILYLVGGAIVITALAVRIGRTLHEFDKTPSPFTKAHHHV